MDFTVFRQRLAELISARGYTPFAFSIEANTTPSTVQRHLSGTRIPTLDCVIKYAEFFDVPIDWLLGRSDDRYNVLGESNQKLLDLYSLASDDDRNVINLILSKYDK